MRLIEGDVDVGTLERRIRSEIRGEVRFDEGSRGLYATDASNFRQVPIGVVLPRDVDDVVATVAAAREHGAPVLPRGGGTSLAGQCCNTAIVLDFSKYMHRVLEVDPDRRIARVEPGVVLDRLREAARPHGLTFGPDPATHDHCTIGGMIGNNSCGVHSVMAGKTVDNVEALEVLTYDGARFRVGPTSDEELAAIVRAGGRRGEIYRALRDLRDRDADRIREAYPDIPRRVSGYNLDDLLPERGFDVARALVGTEGTCATVLEATVRLVPQPPDDALLLLAYRDVYDAADQVPKVLEAGPIGLEGLDEVLVEDQRLKGMHPAALRLLPEGGAWLLVQFGGDSQEEADARARDLMRELEKGDVTPGMRLFDNEGEEEMIWEVRESGLGATARVPTRGDTWPGWEDSAVHPERLGDYLRDLRGLLDDRGYHGAFYGHFGQGCLHTRISFDLRSARGIDRYRGFLEDAAELVVRYGGSLSGEHGDGQQRAELLERMYGPELVRAFREFKAAWDPQGKMNPGKVVDPYRLDEHLRLGAAYAPEDPQTEFRYPDDDFSFHRATMRCVGVGKCRRTDSGTMCPSYMVTREEKHSTRGRARLLHEMLMGDPVDGGWRDEHVKEALDLCLACKGCKNECPVNVDMATYKAEFLSHYYRGRLRPRSAYAMGLIYWWSRLASRVPGLVNAATRAPGLSRLLKWGGGIAPDRELPAFARPFTARSPRERPGEGPEVMLWPDTFTNHLEPEIADAAADALGRLGFRVTLPPRPLCCGRPLYDYGMLRLARRQLRQILDVLRPQIRRGIPVVGLEPSCVSVFRDELRELFPRDEDARRLSRQVFTFAEWLREAGVDLPRLERRAIVQGHCHHKAIMGMDAEEELFARLGLRAETLDSGCCGMAGSFGFEAEKSEVAQAAGERVLLPAVRAADDATIVVADGFSCRTQIRQGTDRRALHTAEVVQMALREGPEGPGGRPEATYRADRSTGARGRGTLALVGVGLAALAGAAAASRRRRVSRRGGEPRR